MLIQKTTDFRYSEITPKTMYLQRREFIQAATSVLLTATAALAPRTTAAVAQTGRKLSDVTRSPLGSAEKLNSYDDITTYNNFYEFGTDKESPSQLARNFKTGPWTIAIEGHVTRPAVPDLDELIKPHPLEERIYRLRCVEAWSMVVPWIGIPLANVLKRFEPTSNAKYVEFVTLNDPVQMPGQTGSCAQMAVCGGPPAR
jgi:methionine sulfoxide reductase catalytic subunit